MKAQLKDRGYYEMKCSINQLLTTSQDSDSGTGSDSRSSQLTGNGIDTVVQFRIGPRS